MQGIPVLLLKGLEKDGSVVLLVIQEDPGEGVRGAGGGGPDAGGVEGFVAQAALAALPKSKHMARRRAHRLPYRKTPLTRIVNSLEGISPTLLLVRVV